MNNNLARVSRRWAPVLSIVLLAALAPALQAEEKVFGGNCSVRSLRGSYGFYRSGNGPFGPLAGQGIGLLDGEGNFHAFVNNSRNGEISLDEEFIGTYEVDRNCTGRFLSEDGSETDRFVVIDGGRGWYGVSVFEGITIYTVATRVDH